MIDQIKTKAKELLKTKKVDIVIGYKKASDRIGAIPAFIDKEGDIDKLIWDGYCVYNLSNYLKDFPGKKIGIVTKGCDAKSMTVLLQENQLKREDIFIIGIECSGIVDEKRKGGDIAYDERCKGCKPATPPIYDVLIKEEEKKQAPRLEQDPYESVRKLETKSIEEKFKFWQDEFSRCIRCYACRQICPLCYCPRCVAEQTQPAWFSKAVSVEGNFSWNVNRAMHLAGRCIDCGECERACPVGIPLRDINKKIEKDVKELFSYEAGVDTEQKPLFSSFDKNDPEDFIK
ncbi:MAG: 4Fe-4S dicluster domain-containing protein [Candidatus Omnitrophica bacterium]|nr:4Fe-4S dicluster domain-containing protein [Candidatus Omnitrophota bacterium]